MMKEMNFSPGMGLGRYADGAGAFSDFKGKIINYGLDMNLLMRMGS